MSTLVDRFLSLGRWRWTPFVGLTAGSTTFVLASILLVPDRIGSVLAPPPRSSARLATGALGAPDGAEPVEPTSTSERITATPTSPRAAAPRVARNERRRGFSPVIREDPEPSNVGAPPPDDPEAHERWRRGQEAASKAAVDAGMRAARGAAIPGNRMHLPPEQNGEPPVSELPVSEPPVSEPPVSDASAPPPAGEPPEEIAPNTAPEPTPGPEE